MASTLNLTEVNLGDNADASKNFRISVPSPADGTLTIERGNGTAVATVGTDGKMTFANNPAIFTGYFESALQTITSAGLLTLAHGFGMAPKLIYGELICLTAEAGYSIGDVVKVALSPASTSVTDSYGCAAYANASNVYIRFGSTAQTFILTHKTTGLSTAITNANWNLRVRAWA